MVEILAAAVLMFSGHPAKVVCLAPWPYPKLAGRETETQQYIAGRWKTIGWRIELPRSTCRDLVRPRPQRENLDTLTHELIHVRFPSVRHGAQMARAVRKWLPTVRWILRTL